MKYLNGSLGLWLCLLSCCGDYVAANKEHFCDRNVTIRSLRPVTKQRTIIKQPSKWKLWKKAQTITEVYNAHDEHISYKLISECCAGYSLTELGLCVPICERGCPAYASCVAPGRCQCTSGYVTALKRRDASFYCEPVCERACASGALCVSPNTCACHDGYRALEPLDDGVSGPCVPICQLGDGCANGRCVDVERCECHAGFSWDTDALSCVQTAATSMEQSTEYVDLVDLRDALRIKLAEQFTEPPAPAVPNCEPGFVPYAGECRPEIFESNETEPPHVAATMQQDCRQPDMACAEHQLCGEQGNCSCASGYSVDDEASTPAKLVCKRGLLGQILSIDQAADDNDELNPLTIPILGVASGCMFVILIVGLLKSWQMRRERLADAVPKETLQCEFSQKTYEADEWVP